MLIGDCFLPLLQSNQSSLTTPQKSGPIHTTHTQAHKYMYVCAHSRIIYSILPHKHIELPYYVQSYLIMHRVTLLYIELPHYI